jgi:hypothetical protein
MKSGFPQNTTIMEQTMLAGICDTEVGFRC